MHGFEIISTLNDFMSREFFTILEVILFAYIGYLVQEFTYTWIEVAIETKYKQKVAIAFRQLMNYDYRKLVKLVKELNLPTSSRKKENLAYAVAVYSSSL